MNDRLRVSPNFAVAFALDGRAYVAKETEPYIHYWLTDRDRLLHAMFAGRRGATVDEALAAYVRAAGVEPADAERARLRKAIDDMRTAGVLVGVRDDASRYTSEIVDSYTTHRAFPRELADLIIRSAPVVSTTRALDLAGGPGDLAIALAAASADVSMMELSRGFLAAATRRAAARGLRLTPIHDSCNRLVFRDDTYDVVTVAQALHWLDDVQVCRGICRVLRRDGSFFVIHGGMEVAGDHPLASVFGNESVLGRRRPRSFVDDVAPLLRRLTLLFDALDAPDVERVDVSQARPSSDNDARIVPSGVFLFRQRRPFDAGYARAFITEQHLVQAGLERDAFWRDLDERASGAGGDDFIGTQHFAVLHFRRGGPRLADRPLDGREAIEIGYAGARS